MKRAALRVLSLTVLAASYLPVASAAAASPTPALECVVCSGDDGAWADLLYDLSPMDTALTHAAALLQRPSRSRAYKKLARAALKMVRQWQQARQSSSTALDHRSAAWLAGRLLQVSGDAKGAEVAFESLVSAPWGALSDEARVALSALWAKRRERRGDAGELLLGLHPGADGFMEHIRRGVGLLDGARRGGQANELLASLLDQSMAGADRAALTLLLAERLGRAPKQDKSKTKSKRHSKRKSKSKRARKRDHKRAQAAARDAARALLWPAWWDARRATDRRDFEVALKKLKRPIHWSERLARDVINATPGKVKALKKGLKKRVPRTRYGTAMRRWAEAVLGRWDKRGRAKADRSLKRLKGRLAKHKTYGPLYAFGQAHLWRKMDRDVEAIDAYLHVAKTWPEHPLADRARWEGSGLARFLGDSARADALDLQLAMGRHYSARQRDALWFLSLRAVAGSHWGRAQRWLELLDARYGSERDRHSIAWGARAKYWLGRVASGQGDVARARDYFQRVVTRFPAGWYALVARQRLESDATPSRAAIARDPVLDTAVALYRVGDLKGARRRLSALMRADYLPGTGRKLLAELQRGAGDMASAKRTLRHGGILPWMPAREDAALLGAWFHYDHDAALREAAAENDLAPALIAGIAHVETRFRAKERSGVGAIGLCQLMPTVGTAWGRKLYGPTFKKRQLWDPEVNLRVAASLLAQLQSRYGPNPIPVLAAFNAGGGPVRRWLVASGELPADLFVEAIPFSQARRYVKRVMATAEIYRRLYDLGDTPVSVDWLVTPAAAPAPEPSPAGGAAAQGDDR